MEHVCVRTFSEVSTFYAYRSFIVVLCMSGLRRASNGYSSIASLPMKAFLLGLVAVKGEFGQPSTQNACLGIVLLYPLMSSTPIFSLLTAK